MMQEVIINSFHDSKLRNSLIKPAKKMLTNPSKLYRIIELRLKRFTVGFYL